MSEEKPSEETNGGERGAKIRKYWFSNLSKEKQDEVILPAFDKAHPTNADKVNARKKWEG